MNEESPEIPKPAIGASAAPAEAPGDMPLLRIEGVTEAFVLSTCNRTEALVVGPRGVDVAPRVRAQLFRNLPEEQSYGERLRANIRSGNVGSAPVIAALAIVVIACTIASCVVSLRS